MWPCCGRRLIPNSCPNCSSKNKSWQSWVNDPFFHLVPLFHSTSKGTNTAFYSNPALDKILVPEVFPKATALGEALAEGHNRIIKKYGHPWCAVSAGANGTVYWRPTLPTNYREWLDQDFEAFWRYWHMNLNRGVIPQAQCYDEQWTVSTLHSEKDVDRMLDVFNEIAREMR